MTFCHVIAFRRLGLDQAVSQRHFAWHRSLVEDSQRFVPGFKGPYAPAQGAVVVQMFPWGWHHPDGTVEREGLYRGAAQAVSARYFRWLSPSPADGLLQRCVPTAANSDRYTKCKLDGWGWCRR